MRSLVYLCGVLLTVTLPVHAQLHPSPETDMRAPNNSTRIMPNAPLGSEYPTHGNAQAGELNLNPTDPRAQLSNGLPNNANSGGYGSPLAGSKANVPTRAE